MKMDEIGEYWENDENRDFVVFNLDLENRKI